MVRVTLSKTLSDWLATDEEFAAMTDAQIRELCEEDMSCVIEGAQWKIEREVDFLLTANLQGKKKKAKPADPRHRIFTALLVKAHEFYVKDVNGKGVTPLLGVAPGNHLKKLLAANKNLDEKQFRRWLNNYHRSDDHNPYDMPAHYILRLPKYEGGPLNKFGRIDAAS